MKGFEDLLKRTEGFKGLLKCFLFLMFVSILPTCIPVHCGGQKRPLGSLELEFIDGCGLPCGYWNLNWGHLVLEKEGCCSFLAAQHQNNRTETVLIK